MSPSKQVWPECGQGPENARPVGCRETGAKAQTLIQNPSLVVLVPLMGAPLSRVQRMTPDRPVTPVGRERCRKRGAYARDPVGQGSGLVGPDTTVFRGAGSVSLRSEQTPGNDSDEAPFRKPTL